MTEEHIGLFLIQVLVLLGLARGAGELLRRVGYPARKPIGRGLLVPILLSLSLFAACEWVGNVFIGASQHPLAQPLIDAAGRGDLAEVDRLLEAGAPLQDPLALQAAVLKGRQEMVRHLVDRGAPVNGDGELQSPLWFAVAHGDVQMSELLISVGADVDWQTDQMGTPLHAALHSLGAEGLRTQLARMLLENGADVNRTQVDPMLRTECLATALHAAVFALEEAAIDVLIEFGADVRATDQNGRSALQCAKERLQIIRSESLRPGIEAIIVRLEAEGLAGP